MVTVEQGTPDTEARGPGAAAAAFGAKAWLVYAVLECWFATVLPWTPWVTPRVLNPAPLELTILTFVLYPALGAVLGGLLGLLIGLARKSAGALELARSLAASTVPLAIAANLLDGPRNRSFQLILVATTLAVVLMLVPARRLERLPVLAMWRSPWATSALLLGLVWLWLSLEYYESPTVMRFVAGAILFLLVAGAAFAASALRGSPARLVRSSGFLILLAAASLAVSAYANRTPAAPFPEPGRSASSAPNVIFLTLDTVAASHLSVYGYERETSPELAKLAAGATLYERAVAPGANTLASHASFFTGFYPSEHGAKYDARGKPQPLHPRFVTLAELLSDNGYSTSAIVGNWSFLAPWWRLDQGFDYYDARKPRWRWWPVHTSLLRSRVVDAIKTVVDPGAPGERYLTADEINAQAFGFLERHEEGHPPFFLFVNYMDAHHPYLPPEPFDTRFPGLDPDYSWDGFGERGTRVMRDEEPLPAAEREHLVSQYDGAIAYVDSRVGELVQRLRDLGLYQNTLLIVTSDHGEAFGAKFLMTHGKGVYQDDVGIPLIVKSPGQTAPAVVSTPVSGVDLVPTVLGLLGLEPLAGISGVDLETLAETPDRVVLSDNYPAEWLRRVHPRFVTEFAAVRGDLKLVRSLEEKRELYDLSTDPAEEHDLLEDERYSAALAELEAYLSEWLEGIDTEAIGAFDLKGEMLDRLRQVGYAE